MINRIESYEISNFDSLVKKTVGLIERTKNKTSVEEYFPTYYEDLDQLIDGLEIGKVTAIVGRPSMGKTLLALNIIRNIVIKRTPTLVFSLSLSKEDCRC